MMARLAAFDMDGTLLMPDHRLGEQTVNALQRLRERDITLTLRPGGTRWRCVALSVAWRWMLF